MADMVQTSDELLTVKEAAALLKVSPYTIYRWVSAGRLPGVRYGRRVLRLRRSDVETARVSQDAHAQVRSETETDAELADLREFPERWRKLREKYESRPKAPDHGTVAALRRRIGVLDEETGEEFVRIIHEMKVRDRAEAIAEQRAYKPLFDEK